MIFNTLFLQDTTGGAGGSSWIFMIAIIVIFYFFMIRPQQQQQKKLREERNKMQKGDHVITNGGIYGKIEGVITRPNKKNVEEVESFIISVKPDYQLRIQVSKECVFKDITDVQQAAK